MIASASTVGQLVTALLRYPLSTPIGDVQVTDGRASSNDPMRLRIVGDVDPEAAVREALRVVCGMAELDEAAVTKSVDVADILDAVRPRT